MVGKLGRCLSKDEQRSWNMSRIKSRNTKLELKVRKYLYSRGYRYRINVPLPGKPDIVFTRRRIAIFVNGCFWHMHRCKLSGIPKTNTEFWFAKLQGNQIRDMETEKRLREGGWKVIKLWQCELKEAFPEIMSYLVQTIEEHLG